MTPEVGKDITRMMYGTLCFWHAVQLFRYGPGWSVGRRVLGPLLGLGSENGALLIVLWTAAILHARWDGWVKDRGFAVLAVGGNIWTAWSWFGVNQLGVGLHAYGKTEGTLRETRAVLPEPVHRDWTRTVAADVLVELPGSAADRIESDDGGMMEVAVTCENRVFRAVRACHDPRRGPWSLRCFLECTSCATFARLRPVLGQVLQAGSGPRARSRS